MQTDPSLPVRALEDGVDVLWLTAGLGCDGESIALTAATQPARRRSARRNACRACRRCASTIRSSPTRTATRSSSGSIAPPAARSTPFILVVEGSIPDETNKAEGYWATFGTDAATGQPILTSDWIDRLAPRAWAVVAVGTCAAYGGIHAMEGNPTGCMGLARLPRRRRGTRTAGVPLVCVPGCPTQPDNLTETLLYLARQIVGRAPMIPLDSVLRPTWLFGQTVHEGCDRGGYYEQADFADRPRLAALHRQARLLGAGRAVQRRQTRLDGRHRRLRQRRRHLHRLHHARVPRQVPAVHGSAAGLAAVV